MDSMLLHGDCLELMKDIPDQSVDMVLTDLPYALTAQSWDTDFNLANFRQQIRRIRKPHSAIVLFAGSIFTYKLQASNLDEYRYKWIWVKNRASNFAHAKNRTMSQYEAILVFSDGVCNHASLTDRRMKYFPQGLLPNTKHRNPRKKNGNVYGHGNSLCHAYKNEWRNYPHDVLFFDTPLNQDTKLHPNQKPVDLLEYLIKTYTQEGELVLDATMGSGSTCVAAVNSDRKFIGIEKDEHFYQITCRRVAEAESARKMSLF